MIALDGPRHLAQRRLLLPPFHGKRMRAYGLSGLPTLMIGADHEAAATLVPAFRGDATVIECAPEPGAVAPHLADWLRRL